MALARMLLYFGVMHRIFVACLLLSFPSSSFAQELVSEVPADEGPLPQEAPAEEEQESDEVDIIEVEPIDVQEVPAAPQGYGPPPPPQTQPQTRPQAQPQTQPQTYPAPMTPEQRQQAFARIQRPGTMKNAIGIHAIALLVGQLSIQYERAVGNYVGLMASMQFILFDAVLESLLRVPDVTIRGYGGLLGVRFYPMGRAPTGLWLGPVGELTYVSVTSGTREGDGVGFGIGLGTGYTWHFGHFMFESSAIIGFQKITASDDSGAVAESNGLWYGIRLAIGVAF